MKRNGCQRTVYESREAAAGAARRLMREGQRGWQTAYLCRQCRRWHTGHPIQSAPLALRPPRRRGGVG